MDITIAKYAGFCFGVTRAVKMCEDTLEKYGKCYTLGPIIHNRTVVEALREKGADILDAPEDAGEGDVVLVRSHGISKAAEDTLKSTGATVVDATCPFVSKIHDITRRESQKGRTIVIIGQAEHPEVVGIAGWCSSYLIFNDGTELKKWLTDDEKNRHIPISVVSQTTGNRDIYEICNNLIKKLCTNAEIFDTICDTTYMRQKEAARLSQVSDVMIVIGGQASSNTKKIADICRENCPRVYMIERAEELSQSWFKADDHVGITAGASTPAWIIKEVNQTMSEEMKNETIAEVSEPVAEPNEETESFEEMLEKSIKTLHTGEKVTGIVAAITPTEVSVDLGTKHAGYIPLAELSADPNAKAEDIVKVGDEVEAFVMRVNDVEGTVMLSKKRLDSIKNWDIIEQLRESKETVEGVVTEENKGGIIVMVKGMRVFVPASQTGLPKDTPMSTLLKENVKLRITEVNQSRRRIVGSIRAVAYEERRAKAEAIWNEIEVGKVYTGVVKSMTSYGAFVDIGGIDGMVHVSEISWSRIKQPSDVFNIGDEIEVYVLSFDKEKKKISLGYKKEEDNPWVKFTNSINVGDVVKAKIVKLMPFGAFAEIIPGVDGLIHISQIADRRIGTPAEVLSEGQEVDVKVTEIDNEKHKVSLSIRALLEDNGGAADIAEDEVSEEE